MCGGVARSIVARLIGPCDLPTGKDVGGEVSMAEAVVRHTTVQFWGERGRHGLATAPAARGARARASSGARQDWLAGNGRSMALCVKTLTGKSMHLEDGDATCMASVRTPMCTRTPSHTHCDTNHCLTIYAKVRMFLSTMGQLQVANSTIMMDNQNHYGRATALKNGISL